MPDKKEKITNKHFKDWENDVFGYGYGTGEEFIIPALKKFLELTDEDGCYSHEILSKELTPTVTWLLINTLINADIIDYGTSPRYAWLNEKGKLLKEFVLGKTVEELQQLCSFNPEHTYCYRGECNCHSDNKCNNPLF